MAKPKTPNRPYTDKEKEYIRRVATRVPADVMAKAIGVTWKGLVCWASRHNISLAVPVATLELHWPEHAERVKKGGRYGGKKASAPTLQK